MSKNRFEIEGDLRSTGELDFAETRFAVLAFVGDDQMGRAAVDERGHYRIAFESDQPPAATELRVVPAELADRAGRVPAVAKTFSPYRYVAMNHGTRGYHAALDLPISRDYRTALSPIAQTYRIHGGVYVYSLPLGLHGIRPLAGARIDFYEVDPPGWTAAPPFPFLRPRPGSEVYLGSVETDPAGGYEFSFDFTSLTGVHWPYAILLDADLKPDVRARIHQFANGVWQEIGEFPTSWNVEKDLFRVFLIAERDLEGATYPVPDAGAKPAEGFRYSSLGLLPIDTTRIVGGYATADSGDPERIQGVRHQPFCGLLRMFGLFADSPQVTEYQVEIAEADASGPTGSWRKITDPLHNRRWNAEAKKWEHVVLGPDPGSGRYRNVDIEEEADWHEHALKVSWNSANEPDGFWALRITGFDETGAEVTARDMPYLLLRVDNHVPQASIEAVGAGVCGGATLDPDRRIRFRITAHDPQGHVFRYWFHATRGKEADVAYRAEDSGVLAPGGSAVETERGADDLWTGVAGQEVTLPMRALSGDLVACPTLPYNVELHVQGLATDCYTAHPSSQRVKREVNLVLSEP